LLLAGGAGTRLWPLSDDRRPKQFLPLGDEIPLIEAAYQRLRRLLPKEQVFVLTAERFVPTVTELLPELPPSQILGEPCRRDTGPALLLAALRIFNTAEDATLAVVTADHIITEPERFISDLQAACGLAAKGDGIVTFGITPDHAATGFGYLKCKNERDSDDGARIFDVERFVEKPNAAAAQTYLDEGSYLWNSGMFCYSARYFITEAEKHMPAHVDALRPVFTGACALALGDCDPLPERCRVRMGPLVAPIVIRSGVGQTTGAVTLAAGDP